MTEPRQDAPIFAAGAPQRAAPLAAQYGHLQGIELLHAMIREFPGRIALASSFGAESAVLLHMASTIDPGLPVIFLNTGKLFDETLRYRDDLVARLGLTGVIEAKPSNAWLSEVDPSGRLWRFDPDLCCRIRKVAPMETALKNFDAWITGRKRMHGGQRTGIDSIEAADGRIKINPLADWSRGRIEAYLDRENLPRHPLEAEGFPSIGCVPCTARPQPGSDVRSGRWAGQAKTECGIHLPYLAAANGESRR
jgi:phosphoadenosine phosphosulfate reductase